MSKPASRQETLQLFNAIRQRTEQLCSPLETEDYVVQPIPDVSPPKWHLGHTTWFFDVLCLKNFQKNYKPVDPVYHYLFNSYYIQLGERWLRVKRGDLTRPTVKAVYQYRKTINEAIGQLIHDVSNDAWLKLSPILTLGIHHEQQHQELFLYDIKYILCHNPVKPIYNSILKDKPAIPEKLPDDYFDYVAIKPGNYPIGHSDDGFCYDNEQPGHQVYLNPYSIRKGLVTNGEFMNFMADSGYEQATLWLDDGWAWRQKEAIEAPLYWYKEGNNWFEMTLNGYQPVNPFAPVSHISFYEVAAFANWAGKRLPTEFEWEVAASLNSENHTKKNTQDLNYFHPLPPLNGNEEKLYQMMSDVWEWTYSGYLPYPGFRAASGPEGEYNGKFMVNQMVLKGASCATPANHIRKTYRNFFHPGKRWVFNGFRLVNSSF
jgi:ergothioneine biosynthesis protein EgtB